ncbi:Aste57867_17993 [Aphanomyces stellatus]|uniref:Aste57867_17993 protein n=1 Tax=Aphanomyces stellatus TaxID=120398 RepID=A0A485LA57_9STRA|nr:hypothetical protein As57867_017931 [Aphanomyces stellatus]VFT94732.1 Aste57867_17993 [Aphanomyces stellatus]
MSSSMTRFQDMHVNQDNMHLIHVAQDDMKQVTIHSTASSVVEGDSDPFTLYTLIVTCPATKTWWIIKKRYSQFYKLRQYLAKMRKACKSKTLDAILQPLMKMVFPKKSIRLDTQAMVAERKAAFDNLTATLMAIRSECVFASIQHQGNEELVLQLAHACDVIEVFLQVPDLQKKEEVRHTSMVLTSPEMTALRASFNEPHSDDDAVDENDCPICLCDLDTDEKVLHMGCGHSFHEACVMQWLELKMSCPLCRQTSICGVNK